MNRKVMPVIQAVKDLNVVGPERSFLSNGIPVVALHAGSEPICRLDVIFDAGSRYQDKTFTASLTNQMIPEGTPGRTGAEIAGEFEFYGSFFDVSCDRDHADLTLHTLEKHLEPVLDTARGILLTPTFPEEELGIIKRNRIQSLMVDNQRVESLSKKTLNRAIFGNHHPYGLMGEPGDIEPVSREDLLAFYKGNYSAPNCRILVTGRDPGLYVRLIDKCLGTAWPGDKERPVPDPAPLPAVEPVEPKTMNIVRNDAVQSSVRMGKTMFNRRHPDFHGLTIVNTILGGYFGSRLMKNIREAKGLTYGISSHLVPLKDHGYFTIISSVEAGSSSRVIDECIHEINRLREECIGKEELDIVRSYLAGQIQRSVDGPLHLAGQFRSLWLHDCDFRHLQDLLQLLITITPQRIRDLAAQYLDPAGMTTVVVGPGNNG